MPRIVLTKDLKHEQVEFPQGTPHPEGRRGGDKSSLHLRRNSVRDVTDEELEHIRQTNPRLFACLEILPEPQVPPGVVRRLADASKPPAKKAAASSPSKTKAKSRKPKATGGDDGGG